jgi:hypothetical protein
MRVPQKVPDILHSASDQIIETNNPVAFVQQSVAEM